eukprot:5947247-Prymnesium_polylepis.1
MCVHTPHGTVSTHLASTLAPLWGYSTRATQAARRVGADDVREYDYAQVGRPDRATARCRRPGRRADRA